jgi:flagellar hook-associated protein 3 FlgL
MLDGGNIWLSASSGNGVFETKSVNSQNAWVDSGHVTDPSQITGSTYDITFSVQNGQTTYSVLKDGQPTAQANQPYVSGQAIAFDGQSMTISGTPADGDKFESAPSQKNLSVFDTLDNIAKQLSTPQQGGAAVTQAVQDGLRNIDQVAAQISDARSFAGTTLTRLDGVKGRLDATQLSAETARSDAEDLDMVQALSNFNNQQTGYSAALQSYATIQKLSLFNYLNA